MTAATKEKAKFAKGDKVRVLSGDWGNGNRGTVESGKPTDITSAEGWSPDSARQLLSVVVVVVSEAAAAKPEAGVPPCAPEAPPHGEKHRPKAERTELPCACKIQV